MDAGGLSETSVGKESGTATPVRRHEGSHKIHYVKSDARSTCCSNNSKSFYRRSRRARLAGSDRQRTSSRCRMTARRIASDTERCSRAARSRAARSSFVVQTECYVVPRESLLTPAHRIGAQGVVTFLAPAGHTRRKWSGFNVTNCSTLAFLAAIAIRAS
jgi:hypothetical protein